MNEKPNRTGKQAGVFTVPDAVIAFGLIALFLLAPAAVVLALLTSACWLFFAGMILGASGVLFAILGWVLEELGVDAQ